MRLPAVDDALSIPSPEKKDTIEETKDDQADEIMHQINKQEENEDE